MVSRREQGRVRERRTHRFIRKSEARCQTGGLPTWMRRCWPPSPRRGCSHRRRWCIGGLLRQGKLFNNPRPMRSSPSSPFMSMGSGIPRTNSCAGSSTSGAWSYSTSTQLGYCTSLASSPSMRPSLGWSHTWTSSDGSSVGEPCPRGSHLESHRLGDLPCRRS